MTDTGSFSETTDASVPDLTEAPYYALRCEGLGKSYGTFWAVRELTLAVQQGEIYGLLGPNGAGKTTTLRMMAGLLTPDEGNVWVAGEEPKANPLYVKRKLGFLTGNTRLYQRLTPRELLRFFGELQEMPRELIQQRTEQVIEELGLHEFLGKQCGTLSTGQTQRVNIARALLHDPAILILDEPTSGLDIISADFILQVILRCREQKKAVIFSTHILAETELLCDRIGVMHKAQLVAEGSLAELTALTRTQSMAEAFLALVRPNMSGMTLRTSTGSAERQGVIPEAVPVTSEHSETSDVSTANTPASQDSKQPGSSEEQNQ